MTRITGGGWKLAGALVALAGGLVCLGAYESGWMGFISTTIVSPQAAALSPPYPECRVAILRSEYSSTFFHSPKTYDAHTEYWQKLLKQLQMPGEVITDSKLEAGLQGIRTLIMPAAICLSKKERASIRALLANGGGVICTWATGARDESGEWQGLDFLGELTGADKLEFGQRPPPWYVSFVTSRPTTAGAPGGFRVQVDSPDRLEAKSFTVDGYWSDPRLSPVDPNLPVNFQGAQIHNSVGSGRVVWFGFQENTAVAGGNDQALLDQALTNALVWAGQQTLGAVDSWPSSFSAAAIFACDVEEDINNAAYAASALRKAQGNGTFFCVSNLVKGNPELVRQLKGAGEVASHGDTANPFNSGGRYSQSVRLASSQWELWRAGGGGTSGFHPPSDVFGDATVSALAATHFHYWLAGLEGGTPVDSVLPEIHRVSQSLGWLHRDTDLVKLTRVFEDDLHYSPLGIVGLEPAWITQRALSDFEIVHGLGGLYIFDYHSQGFSTPEYVGILARLIEQFRQSATWIATAAEVAEWWELRSRVAMSISDKKANGVRLTVRYTGAKPLDNVTLSIFSPGKSLHGRVVAAGPSPTADVAPENADGRLTVRLGRLQPGTTCQYDLTWAQ